MLVWLDVELQLFHSSCVTRCVKKRIVNESGSSICRLRDRRAWDLPRNSSSKANAVLNRLFCNLNFAL